MRFFRNTFVVIALTIPLFAFAAGIVPACDGPDCQACDLLKLVDNVLKFVFELASFIAVLTIMYVGWEFMTSGDNAGKRTAAKKRIENIAIGIALMLAAWLIVDTGLKLLFKDQAFGVWNEIQCVALPEYTQRAPDAVSTTPTVGVPDTSKGSCTTCVKIEGVNCKNNCTVSQAYADRLKNLNLSSIRITEAYPPTSTHKNQCHYNGTCTDVALTNGDYSPASVAAFQEKAAAAGFRAVYEPGAGKSCSGYSDCVSFGTAPHFSLYMK